MTNRERRKNDRATTERREEADRTLSDNRDRNDALTQERRFKADKTMSDNRTRNDEITANRREMKDGNGEMVLAISFALIVLTVVALFIFF